MRNIIKQILKEEFDSKSDRIKSIVKKYGYIKASDLIVGGVDTIKQTYQDNPESYLDQFNDLTPVDKDGKIIYVDENRLPIFYYYLDDEHNYVYINYSMIWMFFEQLFNFTDNEINDIITNWLEVIYNISDLTPINFRYKQSIPIGR